MPRLVGAWNVTSKCCHESRPLLLLNAATSTVMVGYSTCANRSAARTHELM